MQTTRRGAFTITPTLKKAIVKIIDERIGEAHVTKEDFSELKNIVKDLGVKVGELAEAQKRTEVKVEELAEAQKKTEGELHLLAQELRETRHELKGDIARANGQIGGLSRSMGYAFENEAYRMLPGVLKEKYGIDIKERLLRADIGGREINIFGRAVKEGREVLLVGESKLRLDERRDKKSGEGDVFTELEEKAETVMEEYGDVEIIKVLIAHYATKGFLKKAGDKGIIVVQSFEW